MTVKQELEQIERIDNEINELLEQRRYYYDLVTKITPVYKDVNVQEVTVDGSKIDTYITRTADILVEIEKRLKELDAIRDKYNALIEQIDDVKMRRLLRLRYFMYRKWSDIQEEIYPDYTLNHVKGYIHGKSLQKLNRLIPNNT